MQPCMTRRQAWMRCRTSRRSSCPCPPFKSTAAALGSAPDCTRHSNNAWQAWDIASQSACLALADSATCHPGAAPASPSLSEASTASCSVASDLDGFSATTEDMPAPAKRKVAFTPTVHVVLIPSHHDITPWEKADRWWSHTELTKMRCSYYEQLRAQAKARQSKQHSDATVTATAASTSAPAVSTQPAQEAQQVAPPDAVTRAASCGASAVAKEQNSNAGQAWGLDARPVAALFA
ncbi:hypothetical protein JKP88DRAFT_252397 [Tribonema minus]|uniref:Uncharacterized protein n=1 Tax=Tribonema minus TaxID=303371 RepID=A0A835ZF19_9STRA|nr:hypothetical protein JKP88DRAFT_252397 [Tribonema minus]